MRTWMLGAIALAVGCATSGQDTKKSQAMSAQEEAHQSLQMAADAQKRAADEQAKVEADQRDVEQAQRALADAQAKLRGQQVKARQAQQDAQRLSADAQKQAEQHQQQALSAQEQQGQEVKQKTEERQQTWTAEKTLEGRVVRVEGDQLQLQSAEQGTMKLDLTDSTAINMDGRSAKAGQIQPGSDVRASYQLIDGKAKALSIDVTSSQQSLEPQEKK